MEYDLHRYDKVEQPSDTGRIRRIVADNSTELVERMNEADVRGEDVVFITNQNTGLKWLCIYDTSRSRFQEECVRVQRKFLEAANVSLGRDKTNSVPVLEGDVSEAVEAIRHEAGTDKEE